MKSKASYFSVSKPLVIENLRRFWAIPALAFLVYFLSGIFPILMSYRRLDSMGRYIAESLSNHQPFYMFAHLLFPIVTAVVIFKYLQGISSVSVMHSLPFTRAKLYNSGFLSGLILIAAPILVNGLLLLLISKPVYNQYPTEQGIVTETVNLFSRTDVLNWIWVSLLIAFVIYMVSVFAGIVTGNSLMHFATAVWFNFLIPALYAIFVAYFSHYLYGFDTSGNWTEFGMRISPFLNIIQTDGVFSAGDTIYYILSFLILYAVTFVLYQKRNLEHATDSLVFRFMEPVICYLIAFLGMTLIGFYFTSLGQSEIYWYAGLAAGTVIFFIIGQMIVKKTPRIYNRGSLKSFGIYVLIAVLFLLSLNFDVTGFEKRLPSSEKIQNVACREGFTMDRRFNQYYYSGNASPYGADGKEFRMKDPANIDAVRKIHQSLVEDKNRFETTKNVHSTSLRLSYNPDGKFPFSRAYQMDYDFYRNSPEFKQIYESTEFKEYFSPQNLNYEKLSSIYLSSGIPNREPVEIKGREAMQEFLTCVDQDFKAQSFEDMASLKRPYATAEISFTFRNPNSNMSEKPQNGAVTYVITDGYKNTIQWLQNHDYGSRFTYSVSEIDYIDIYHYVRQEGSDKIESVKTLKVTDPAQIQLLLDRYETQSIYYNDYYEGVVVYKGGVQPVSPDQFYKEYGYDSAMEAYDTSAPMTHIYFNSGNVPDFILDYFK